MKVCPLCGARCFDDMAICYGCMHRFDDDMAEGVQPVKVSALPEEDTRSEGISGLAFDDSETSAHAAALSLAGPQCDAPSAEAQRTAFGPVIERLESPQCIRIEIPLSALAGWAKEVPA